LGARLAVDVRRAFLACGLLVALCVSAIVIASWSGASLRTAPRSNAPSSEAGLSTGSMLVVSPTGKLCRERTIDNGTWRMRDNGLVDCEEALAKASAAEGRSPGSRMELIRQGFHGSP
jgi:hypothetical protein